LLVCVRLVAIDRDRRVPIVLAVGGATRSRGRRGGGRTSRASLSGSGLRPRGRDQAGGHPQPEPGRQESSHERPGTAVASGIEPRLQVARTPPVMFVTSSATRDSKPVPFTTAPDR